MIKHFGALYTWRRNKTKYHFIVLPFDLVSRSWVYTPICWLFLFCYLSVIYCIVYCFIVTVCISIYFVLIWSPQFQKYNVILMLLYLGVCWDFYLLFIQFCDLLKNAEIPRLLFISTLLAIFVVFCILKTDCYYTSELKLDCICWTFGIYTKIHNFIIHACSPCAWASKLVVLYTSCVNFYVLVLLCNVYC